MLQFRPATIADHDHIWEILLPIIERGDSLVYLKSMSKEKMLSYWLGPDKRCYVAEEDGQVLGSFWIKDNHLGRGSHIANAAYVVSSASGGRGVGKQMGLYSLDEARRLGYRAMQFNLVVKTNEKAVRLWQSIGFKIIGEIPEAFEHKELGWVNAYVMYQLL